MADDAGVDAAAADEPTRVTAAAAGCPAEHHATGNNDATSPGAGAEGRAARGDLSAGRGWAAGYDLHRPGLARAGPAVGPRRSYLGCRSVSSWLGELADEQARRVEELIRPRRE
jgi:hypothetical protein